MVILDNDTRWNSQYKSIERAIKLKERIILFCTRYRTDLIKDTLSDDDWTYLQKVKDALYPFYDATIELEGRAGNGHHGSLWEWLPQVEGLMGEMERMCQEYKANGDTTNPLCVAHDAAWGKLNEYYQKSDKAHGLFAAATLLAPECGMAYFDRNWTGKAAKTKTTMIKRVRTEWEKNYRDSSIEAPPAKRPSLLDRQIGRERPTTSGKSDQFATYTATLPVRLVYDDDQHILDWWTKEGPLQLRQMAFDLLSIPATSCDVERVFSSTKRLITPSAASLKDNTIEMRECLRQWLRAGLIELQYL